MPDRRFPLAWSVEERPACYILNDANGQPLAYVYSEEEPGRRTAAKLMTPTRRRIAVNIAKLPDLLARCPDAGVRRYWPLSVVPAENERSPRFKTPNSLLSQRR